MRRRSIATGVFLLLLAAGCSSWPEFERNVKGLDSHNADVRRRSAFALGNIAIQEEPHEAKVVRKLAVMAQSDPDPLVRSTALTSLALRDANAGVSTATKVRTDTATVVRLDAVKVMSTHGGAAVIDVLIEIAEKDHHEDVRRQAVKGLARHNDPRVLAALVARLSDPSVSVAHAAREGLIGLCGEDLGMEPSAWQKYTQ